MKKITLIAALLLAGCADQNTSTVAPTIQQPSHASAAAQRHTDGMMAETAKYTPADPAKRGQAAQNAFNHYLKVYEAGVQVHAAGKTPEQAKVISQQLAQKIAADIHPQKEADIAVTKAVTAHTSAAFLDGYNGK